ncbi:aminotransferase class V-fold PLP-dependent enzyme [Porphyromonas gingivalis]|uniref:aminotransferase class V-fold PLP-dependent enzyme n=1 Tax=Porphyromonas gingivalis TaxID=837 RepID=UPI001F1B5DF7|nr:cysteine desulfurase [Porphyromonas gingivalis]MCE8170971.1 cysteine desulfurase [Porphyromonas gingivalis]
MYDIQKIREDFPILHTRVHGKPLIYLDNAATTQKPIAVLDQIERAYRTFNANIHRGVHHLSQVATEQHENARKRIARYIGAEDPKEVLFTRGTTEAINLVASSFGQAFVRSGDEIIISTLEHHSNIVPWQLLAERTGARLRVIRLTESGELDVEHFRSLLNERTKIVSIAHVSNVLGTINPIRRITDLAHAAGVPVLVDGAQAIAHCRVDVRELGVDFYAFSGHKVYAPTGIGVLYGKTEWLEKIPPYHGGGEMIAKVTFEKTTYNELPYKFEAGTPDYVGSTALATALDYIEGLGLEAIAAHEDKLLRMATEGVRAFPNARIIGEAEHKSGVLSFLIGDIHPYDLGMLLDRLGIAIRTGHHCAEPLLESMGLNATARASFALYNTEEEVEQFLQALKRVVSMF